MLEYFFEYCNFNWNNSWRGGHESDVIGGGRILHALMPTTPENNFATYDKLELNPSTC